MNGLKVFLDRCFNLIIKCHVNSVNRFFDRRCYEKNEVNKTFKLLVGKNVRGLDNNFSGHD